MTTGTAIILAVIMWGTPPSRPDFISLEWTMQQRAAGRSKLDSGFHVFNFLCCYVCSTPPRCTLTVVTLNQCVLDGFYPKVEQASTQDGNLKVTWGDGVVEILEETGIENASIRFMVSFECTSGRMCKIKDVSGGYMKNSEILGQIVAVEYVPLRAKFGAFALRKLDCKAVLPAVPEK